MGYDHSSPAIEGQGQRSKLQLKFQFEMRSVGPRSSIEDTFPVIQKTYRRCPACWSPTMQRRERYFRRAHKTPSLPAYTPPTISIWAVGSAQKLAPNTVPAFEIG